MLNTKTTQQIKDRTFNFPSGGALYQLHDDATALNIHDQLTARLTQLDAMFGLITGESFDSFSNLSDKTQRDYLWGCSMLAKECQELASMRPAQGESHV